MFLILVIEVFDGNGLIRDCFECWIKKKSNGEI